MDDLLVLLILGDSDTGSTKTANAQVPVKATMPVAVTGGRSEGGTLSLHEKACPRLAIRTLGKLLIYN